MINEEIKKSALNWTDAEFKKSIYDTLVKEKSDKVPLKRGCRNSVCYCTGKCNEVVGWRDKTLQEKLLGI